MTTEQIQEEWGKAIDALKTADENRVLGHADRSIMTSYAAMMHATKAALGTHGLDITCHGGLSIHLAQVAIRTASARHAQHAAQVYEQTRFQVTPSRHA